MSCKLQIGWFDMKYTIREENNGITVHNNINHMYFFYEGLRKSDIKGNIDEFLENNKDKLTKNIDAIYPFYVGWQVSGICNLDCVYCFADNSIHSKNTDDILETVNNILEVNPLVVGLSGGEPTLNSRLPEVIQAFAGKCALILNTNGTTNLLGKAVPDLKQANVLVRLTVDGLNNDLLNKVRPPVKMPVNGFDQVTKIKSNIKLLIDYKVPLVIHTVITKYNIDYLEETAHQLIGLGVKNWHFYLVEKCYKCKDIFDDIMVPYEDMKKHCDDLITKFGDKLHITYPTSSSGKPRDNAILLVNSQGEFYVDAHGKNPEIIGKNPSIQEIHKHLDYPFHTKCYIANFWDIV